MATPLSSKTNTTLNELLIDNNLYLQVVRAHGYKLDPTTEVFCSFSLGATKFQTRVVRLDEALGWSETFALTKSLLSGCSTDTIVLEVWYSKRWSSNVLLGQAHLSLEQVQWPQQGCLLRTLALQAAEKPAGADKGVVKVQSVGTITLALGVGPGTGVFASPDAKMLSRPHMIPLPPPRHFTTLLAQPSRPAVVHTPAGTLYEEPCVVYLKITMHRAEGLNMLIPEALANTSPGGRAAANPRPSRPDSSSKAAVEAGRSKSFSGHFTQQLRAQQNELLEKTAKFFGIKRATQSSDAVVLKPSSSSEDESEVDGGKESAALSPRSEMGEPEAHESDDSSGASTDGWLDASLSANDSPPPSNRFAPPPSVTADDPSTTDTAISVDHHQVMLALESNGFHVSDVPGGTFFYCKLVFDGQTHTSHMVTQEGGCARWKEEFLFAARRPLPNDSLQLTMFASLSNKQRGRQACQLEVPIHSLLSSTDSPSSLSSKPPIRSLTAYGDEGRTCQLLVSLDIVDKDERAQVYGLPLTAAADLNPDISSPPFSPTPAPTLSIPVATHHIAGDSPSLKLAASTPHSDRHSPSQHTALFNAAAIVSANIKTTAGPATSTATSRASVTSEELGDTASSAAHALSQVHVSTVAGVQHDNTAADQSNTTVTLQLTGQTSQPTLQLTSQTSQPRLVQQVAEEALGEALTLAVTTDASSAPAAAHVSHADLAAVAAVIASKINAPAVVTLSAEHTDSSVKNTSETGPAQSGQHGQSGPSGQHGQSGQSGPSDQHGQHGQSGQPGQHGLSMALQGGETSETTHGADVAGPCSTEGVVPPGKAVEKQADAGGAVSVPAPRTAASALSSIFNFRNPLTASKPLFPSPLGQKTNSSHGDEHSDTPDKLKVSEPASHPAGHVLSSPPSSQGSQFGQFGSVLAKGNSASPRSAKEDVLKSVVVNETVAGVPGTQAVGMLNLYVQGFELKEKTADCMCVFSCGPFWGMTAPVFNTKSPAWGWEVQLPIADPSTLLTIALFRHQDNAKSKKLGTIKTWMDTKLIGKLRIRLSTLLPNRSVQLRMPMFAERSQSYSGQTAAYALLGLRLTCASARMHLLRYTQPLMHKPCLLLMMQMDEMEEEALHEASFKVVSKFMEDSSPSVGVKVLRKVQDMGRMDFTLSRTKDNWRRVAIALQALAPLNQWFDRICMWKNPLESGSVALGVVLFAMLPSRVLPLMLLLLVMYLVFVRWRAISDQYGVPRSMTDMSVMDEAEESSATAVPLDPYTALKQQYDTIVAFMMKVQNFLDSVAIILERVSALLNWEDPVATGVFLLLVLLLAGAMSLLGVQGLLCIGMLWLIRPPMLRDPYPPPPVNFFCHLPSKSDTVI